MREVSSPPLYSSPDQVNVADVVFDYAEQYPDFVAYSKETGEGTWSDTTYAQFADEVATLGRGFIAAGIEQGDRVGLMSRTRYEWTLVDFALLSIGAVVVPIYETSSADQVAWIISNSGAVAVVAETADHGRSSSRCTTRHPISLRCG